MSHADWISIAAESITAGGQAFTVIQAAGCAWTASSNAGWIGVSSANGSGNGTVQLVVAANRESGAAGHGDYWGAAFTVTQASVCTIAIAPPGTTLPAGGGSGSFNVTAGASCAWSAAATAG